MKIVTYCMFKDEEATLARLIESTWGITDEFVFLDTGSTDNSISVIKDSINFLNQKNKNLQKRVEVSIIHTPFKNFVETRNFGLDYINENYKDFDYILLMDADEILTFRNINSIENELKEIERLNSVGFPLIDVDINENNTLINRRARFLLIDNEHNKFRYAGPGAHEYITNLKNEHGTCIAYLPNILIDHFHIINKDYNKKFLLESTLIKDYLDNNPDDLRAMFYLGNTFYDAYMIKEATKYYKLYLETASKVQLNWFGEKYEIYLRLAAIYTSLFDYDNAIDIYHTAVCYFPNRKEAIYYLVKLYIGLNNPIYKDLIYNLIHRLIDINSNDYLESKDIVWYNFNEVFNEIYLWAFWYLLNNPAIDVGQNRYTYHKLFTNWKYNFEKYIPNKQSSEYIQMQHNYNWFMEMYNIIEHLIPINDNKNVVLYLGDGGFDYFRLVPESNLEDLLLGGTERSYIELANQLIKDNKNVFIIVNKEHLYDNLEYIKKEGIVFVTKEYFQTHLKYFVNIDTIIFSRYCTEHKEYIDIDRHKNIKRILWLHDVATWDAIDKNEYDLMVVSSEFHRNYINYINLTNDNNINIIPLGISNIDKLKTSSENKIYFENDEFKIIYHICPSRGGYSLFKIIPYLDEMLSELGVQLKVDLYIARQDDSTRVKIIENLDKNVLSNYDVNILNCVPHKKILDKLSEYDAFIYIQDDGSVRYDGVTFLETFCLSIVEAQLAGLLVTGSNAGALQNNLIESPLNNKIDVTENNFEKIATSIFNHFYKLQYQLDDDIINEHRNLVDNKFFSWDVIYKEYWKNIIQ